MNFFKHILCFLLFVSNVYVYAQTADSMQNTAAQDSVLKSTDTDINREIVTVPDSIRNKDLRPFFAKIKTGKGSDTTLFTQTLQQYLLSSEKFGLNKRSVKYIDEPHVHEDKDVIFYVLIGILTVLAAVAWFFSDYIFSLFQSFAQPGYRLSLTSENYALGYFPAFLLNILFVVASAIFLAFLTYESITRFTFWELFGLYAIAIALIYIFKILILRLSGYLFNSVYAAKLYEHVIFTVNKLIGLLLIPLVWMISFSASPQTDMTVRNIFSAFSFILILLLLYRYLASFSIIKRDINIRPFHFFIYLCAIEIIPVLIIYKYLTDNIGNWL